MSQRALLKAVRNHLRLPVGSGTAADGLGYAAAQCEIMFDGQPPPMAGELFVAVHEGQWANTYDEGREDEFGIEVTVTRRLGFVPNDRSHVALVDATDALETICERIAAKIHSNYAIMDATNVIIGAAAGGFHRPLYFRDGGKTEPKTADWWSAEADDPNPSCGMARTLRFGGAVRTQTIESQT